MSKAKKDRFERGSAVYKCTACGKQTRDTGEGERSADMCLSCYREGEQENAIADSIERVKFAGPDWTPLQKKQSEDRLHRKKDQ